MITMSRKKLTTEDFINKALTKFPNNKDKFDYYKVEYKDNRTKVIIICKKHGEFEQRPDNHLAGNGCPICKNEKLTFNTEDFINKALTKFPDNKDKFDYYKVDYQGALENVTIICKKHGEFEQRAASHLAGNGCPICTSKVSKAETEIFNYIKNDLNIDCQQSNRKIIRPKELDIYIPSLKLAFEYNGDYWHSDEKIAERTSGEHETADSFHDMKTLRCRKKGIKLIHIAQQDYIGNEENMFNNIKHIIQERKREMNIS